ncbi:MAG: carbon storage regulator CsrA [Armatimonadota bacterium]
MLVVTRKPGQSVVIGDDVEVVVVAISGQQVRLGIKAPRSVPVHRKEVLDKTDQRGGGAADAAESRSESAAR